MGIMEPVLVVTMILLAVASWLLVYLVFQLYLLRKREVEGDRHKVLMERLQMQKGER